MRYLNCRFRVLTLFSLASLLASESHAVELVYITDLSIYSELAPCASRAVSGELVLQTYGSNCPADVTGLQSCICTNSLSAVSSGIAATVSKSCGNTASDDQASVQTVLNAYCNQASTAAFPTPSNPVTSYIYELPGFTDLAPCASSALSAVVQYNTYQACPSDPAALIQCACDRNQNSLRINQSIKSSVGAVCTTGANDDVSSAQAMFAAYCGLNSGQTAFPTASSPPGDMSYYITDLPQFSSLSSCAGRALYQAVSYRTWADCPDGPQALASCACIKSGISKAISSTITSDVRNFCSSNVEENLRSARDVFDFYCSAAKAEVTATGVVLSRASSTSGPSRTSAIATATSTGTPSPSGGLSKGAIAGAVVGGVLGLLAWCLVFFYMMRRLRRQAKIQARVEASTMGSELSPLSGRADDEHHMGSGEEYGKRIATPSHRLLVDDDISPAAPPPYEPGPYGDALKGK